VTTAGLAEPVMPVGPVAVIERLPLKPLTPVRVTIVVESEFPREIVTVAWLSVELNPAGPTCRAIVVK
jgi:hypothetical protein